MPEHEKLSDEELNYLESQSVNEAGREYAVEEKKRRKEAKFSSKLAAFGKSVYEKTKPVARAGARAGYSGLQKIGSWEHKAVEGYQRSQRRSPRRRARAPRQADSFGFGSGLGGGFSSGNDLSPPSWAKFDVGPPRKSKKKGGGGLWWAKF